MVSLSTSPFAATSSWNTLVPTNATFTKLNWPGSTGYNYSVAWDSYSPAVYVASASDPVVQVSHPAGWGYPAGTVSIHIPAGADGAAGTDGEIIIIDGDVAYNFWQFDRTSTTTATAASFGAENVVTGDGWGSKSPFLSAGITAVGASELGGLLVKAEADDGSIDHALQLVVDRKLVQSGFTGSAIAGDGGSATGIVQEGQFLAIAPGTPMPSGLSPLGQEVFIAMQKYGAYVVDVSDGVTNIRAQQNAFDDATITALWHDMGSITPLLQSVSGGTPTTPTQPTTPTTPTDTTAPTLNWVAASGTGVTNGTGTVGTGGTVRLSLNFSEAVNVTGTPTLALNSNGTANYVSGSGTNTLQFDYTVAAGQSAADLAITGFNLSGVKDLAGNSANLSGAPTQPAGTLAISTSVPTNPTTPTDTTAPTLNWVAANGPGVTNGTGTVGAGGTVRLSLNFSEAVNVTGTPTLALNSNGTASYVSGSGGTTLQFDYTVAAGQSAADLAITGFNLSGVKDLAGNSVNLAGAPTQPAGTLTISAPVAPTDTTAPTLQWVAANGPGVTNGTGTVGAGGTVRLSLNFSEAVNVTGTPTLALNSNGTASYVSGSGGNTLQFDYTVAAGQSAADLAITGFNLSGVKDLAGNGVNLAGAPTQPAGTLAISAPLPVTDTTKPTLQWVAANGPGVTNGTGTVGPGDTVRLSLNFSEAVNVSGTPSLTLNSKGTAKYVSGSGGTTLQFDYTVGSGQRASDLAITGFNLSGVKDLAGNSLNLAGAPKQPAGTLTVSSLISSTATTSSLSSTETSVVSTASALSASGFGNNTTTLGYTAGTTTPTASTTTADATLASQMALFNQYAASSFAAPPASPIGAPPQQTVWSSLSQTLARSAG